MGVDRAVLTVLVDGYEEEQLAKEKRVVLRIRPALAPIKAAVLPLLRNRPELVERARRAHRRPEAAHARRVRRHRLDRQALPAAGRDRDAVLRHGRPRVARRRRGHHPRARLDDPGARVARPHPAAASPTSSPGGRVGGCRARRLRHDGRRTSTDDDRQALERAESRGRPAPDRVRSSPRGPGDDAAHEYRARALLALGRLDEAERHAQDAVRLDPDEIRYRELLAQILSSEGAHRDAAAEFGRLARNDPRQTTGPCPRRRSGSARRSRRWASRRRGVRFSLIRATGVRSSRSRRRWRDRRRARGVRAAAPRARSCCRRPEAREALADARWLSRRRMRRRSTNFASSRDEQRGADRHRVDEKARKLCTGSMPVGWTALRGRSVRCSTGLPPRLASHRADEGRPVARTAHGGTRRRDAQPRGRRGAR